MKKGNKYLTAIRQLNVCKHKGQRRPHQPLLLLIAISNLLQGKKELSFKQAVETLAPLLDLYAPPVKARHQPELPFWHLQGDLWQVEEAESLPRTKGNFPQKAALKQTAGHLTAEFAAILQSDHEFLRTILVEILDQYFPESLHSDIMAAIGLDLPQPDFIAEDAVTYQARRRRDPHFRHKVLRAYENRCAVTGFRAALGGRFFGCEAAHVQWHAYDGPDNVANGISVEPTLHKLFDAGAWTLSDDRRILVSSEFTGSDEAVCKVRELHGNRIRTPQLGEPEVAVEFIRWHRQEDLGGVFRHPALPL